MSLEILRQMGMSDEKIQEKLLDTIARRFLAENHSDVFCDEEDYEASFGDDEDLTDEEIAERRKQADDLRKESTMHKLLGTHLRRHFNKMFAGAASAMGTKVVQPILQEMIAKKVFRHTNQWGEAKGESKTCMEFLEAHCKSYLLEEVDAKGRSKDECNQWDGRDWKKAGQRLDVLIKKECDDRVRDVVRDATVAAAKAVGEAYRERINMAVTMAIDAVKIDVKK